MEYLDGSARAAPGSLSAEARAHRGAQGHVGGL